MFWLFCRSDSTKDLCESVLMLSCYPSLSNSSICLFNVVFSFIISLRMAASWLKIYVRNARSSWLFLMTLINNWVSPWSTGLEARAFLRIPPSLVPKDPLFGGPDGFMAL